MKKEWSKGTIAYTRISFSMSNAFRQTGPKGYGDGDSTNFPRVVTFDKFMGDAATIQWLSKGHREMLSLKQGVARLRQLMPRQPR